MHDKWSAHARLHPTSSSTLASSAEIFWHPGTGWVCGIHLRCLSLAELLCCLKGNKRLSASPSALTRAPFPESCVHSAGAPRLNLMCLSIRPIYCSSIEITKNDVQFSSQRCQSTFRSYSCILETLLFIYSDARYDRTATTPVVTYIYIWYTPIKMPRSWF